MFKLPALKLVKLIAAFVAVAVVAVPIMGVMGDSNNSQSNAFGFNQAEASIDSVYDLENGFFFNNPDAQKSCIATLIEYNIGLIGLDGNFYVEVDNLGLHECQTSAEAGAYVTSFKKAHTATIYNSDKQLCTQEYVLYQCEMWTNIETYVTLPVIVSESASIDVEATLSIGEKKFNIDEYVQCSGTGTNKVKLYTNCCISDFFVLMCSTLDHTLDIHISSGLGISKDVTFDLKKNVDVEFKSKSIMLKNGFLGRSDLFKLGGERLTMQVVDGGVILKSESGFKISEMVNNARNYPTGNLEIYRSSDEFVQFVMTEVDSDQIDIVMYIFDLLEHYY